MTQGSAGAIKAERFSLNMELPKRACFCSRRIGHEVERPQTSNMYIHLSLIFAVAAYAAPHLDDLYSSHDLAEAFAPGAAFPGQVALSGWSIFRRQGCPNLSLLCPSGVCCPYSPQLTSCCGKTCCASGYLCTGGTNSNPCCVAITDPTNTCGTVNTSVSVFQL